MNQICIYLYFSKPIIYYIYIPTKPVSMRFLRITVTLLLLLIINLAQAQKLPFRNYTINDGLPSNFILDICQDTEGYMWFATQLGVSRFDGYKFENFGIDKGLPSNDVRCIYPDSEGNIWFGTYGGGIACFKNDIFRNFTTSDGLIDTHISFIFEDSSGGIWADSQKGISRIFNGSLENYTKSNGLVDNQLVCRYIDSKNRIWLGTARGYSELTVGNTGVRFIGHGLESEIIMNIAEDDEGSIWFATQESGIFKLAKDINNPVSIRNPYSDIILCIENDHEGNLWFGTYEQGAFKYNLKHNKFKFVDETRNQTIRKIVTDRSGRLWLVTIKEGIFLLEDNQIRQIKTINNLLDNSVLSVKVDIEGNVWLGTIGGVSKFSKIPFEMYTEQFGLPQKEVITVLSDSKGGIWVGSYSGLAKLSPGEEKFRTFDINNPVSNEIYSIYEDKSNNIWLGTYMGITRYADNEFKLIKDIIWNLGGEADNIAMDFIEDSNNTLWIANGSGVCKYANNRFYNYTVDSGLSGNQTNALAIDTTGNLWIATSNGVTLYNHTNFSVISTNNGMSNNICHDICVDAENKVWVATDNGLNRITWNGEVQAIKNYSTENGLASNAILFVTTDHKNNLWIGHGKGLNRMDLSSGRIYYYGAMEGFTPLECYERSVSVDKNNDVWIGTGNGLVKYISKYDTASGIKPRTYIKKVDLFNDTTDILAYADGIDSVTGLPEHLILPYNKCNLVFEYVGLHYAIPEKNHYKYMLKGYDERWSEITGKTITDPYRKIPPGNYTFLLLAANSDDEWIDNPVTFNFSIKPPFWKTPWAYAVEIILILAIFYTIVRLRERKLQQDKRILAQKVKERTIEIEQQRDQIAMQNREITSSIMYAKRIQSAVLPSEDLLKKLIPNHFILFKPRDIVSGDFYWVTEKENKIILVASDCTGHGVPGAFMSMLGVSLLNEIVTNQTKLSACEILNLLRDNVKKTLSQKGRQDETKDGMDLVLCIFDFNLMKVQFAGAYNPLWIIRDDELLVYKGDKMPIGIYVGAEKSFVCNDIDLKKNDVIYMFSDGYADQFGGPEEKKFKSGTLKELLLQIYKKPLSEQKVILDRTHEEWKGEQQQIDDIMIIGVKI